MTPDIRTTVVGSYPIPAWLTSQPNRTNLRDAALVVLKTQELANLDVICDGELSRFDVNHPDTNGMIDYFVRPMHGIHSQLSRDERDAFRTRDDFEFRSQPAGVVREDIGEGSLDLPAAFNSIRQLTQHPLKFTLTSPYMLARTLLDCHYENLEVLVMAIADVLRKQIESIDAAVIQIDEANLPGRPQDSHIAAAGINHILAGTGAETGVHLCFGNYGGQTIQSGQFSDLMPFFHALECNHLVLEFARRGYDELQLFRELKPEMQLGLGVVDIKDNLVETPELIARRIESANRTLGPDRVRWIHPDCGFWMLQRSVADRKMQALSAGRDLFLGAAPA
jgi:5-methyltetrahydropteroyltriglutamate--homocysteine methyltransferase